MAKINKETEQKMNGVCSKVVLSMFFRNRMNYVTRFCEFLLLFFPGKPSDQKANSVLVHYAYRSG